jgi:hypothetical protein
MAEAMESRVLLSGIHAASIHARPKLSVSFMAQTVGVVDNGVTYALKGDSFSTSLLIEDIGSAAIGGQIAISYFLSKTPKPAIGSATPLGAEVIGDAAIPAGGTMTQDATVLIPASSKLNVPNTYYLIAKVSAGGAKNAFSVGNPVRLLPKVVNVVTPGFLSDQPGGYTTWNKVLNELDVQIPARTSLQNNVTGFVEKWPATAGFIDELEGIAFEILTPTDSGGAALVATGNSIAAQNANAAAADIAARISDPQSAFYADPLLTARADNPQIIHLIGHSRGAAVNAAAVDLLAGKGYTIDQYTSLDGYSTDWPGLSGQAGDIPIAADIAAAGPHVRRAVNYEVQQGLGPSISGILKKEASSYLSGLHLTAAELQQIIGAFANAKAPDRPAPPFENIVIQGFGKNPISDHVDIGDIYAASISPELPVDERYIRDNFEGENLNT